VGGLSKKKSVPKIENQTYDHADRISKLARPKMDYSKTHLKISKSNSQRELGTKNEDKAKIKKILQG